MAAVGPSEGDIGLDDVRDFLYVALRAQERQSVELKALVEALESRKPDEEWLEQAQHEAAKGLGFHEQQSQAWGGFAARVGAYVDSVRRQGEEMALAELRISEEGGDAGAQELTPARQARTIHPELQKFKLEKQARILGKYGGVPAMGQGMVMPLPPRDVKLKATASPAAIEIQYSKVENKDAHHLAKVMQFKQRKSGDEHSPWQAEVTEKKGNEFFKNHVSPPSATTTSHTPFGGELADKLRSRQAALETAEAASASAPKAKGAGGGATPELAALLQKKTDALRAHDAAEAAQAKRAVADAAGGGTPLNAELTAVLLARRDKGLATPTSGFSFQAVSNAIDDAATTPVAALRPAPLRVAGGTPAAGAATNELAEVLRRRQQKQEAAQE